VYQTAVRIATVTTLVMNVGSQGQLQWNVQMASYVFQCKTYIRGFVAIVIMSRSHVKILIGLRENPTKFHGLRTIRFAGQLSYL